MAGHTDSAIGLPKYDTIYQKGVSDPRGTYYAIADLKMGGYAGTPYMKQRLDRGYLPKRGQWYLQKHLSAAGDGYINMSQEEKDKYSWPGWQMWAYDTKGKDAIRNFYDIDAQNRNWARLVRLGSSSQPPVWNTDIEEMKTNPEKQDEYLLTDYHLWETLLHGDSIDINDQIAAAIVQGNITGQGMFGQQQLAGLHRIVKEWRNWMLFAPEDEKMGLAAYLSEKVGGPWAVTRQPTPPDYVTPSTYQTQTQDTLLGQDPTEPWGIDDPNQTNLGTGILSTNFGTTRSDFLARRQRGDPLGLNGEFS